MIGYIVGHEIGEQKTEHLQGYVEFQQRVYLQKLKQINPRAHWEIAKGNRAQNIDYCSKGDNIESSWPCSRQVRLLKNYDNVKWKAWQKQIIDICETTPHNRKIYWIWEETGNVGKSFLAKYLVLKYEAILCSGKAADVNHQVFQWMDSKPDTIDPRVIVVDCPRTTIDYLNYGTVENIKNGLLFSGKYAGS